MFFGAVAEMLCCGGNRDRDAKEERCERRIEARMARENKKSQKSKRKDKEKKKRRKKNPKKTRRKGNTYIAKNVKSQLDSLMRGGATIIIIVIIEHRTKKGLVSKNNF